MKQLLIKAIKTLAGDVRKSIIGIILVALVASFGGLLAFYESALELSCRIANTPMPLWAIILLVAICVLYIYLTVSQIQSKINQPTLKLPPYIEFTPTPGVVVYIHKESTEQNSNWYCKHCVDIDKVESTLQMVHHSAAGKNYQCHKCKFQFKVPSNGTN